MGVFEFLCIAEMVEPQRLRGATTPGRGKVGCRVSPALLAWLLTRGLRPSQALDNQAHVWPEHILKSLDRPIPGSS
jgi:hypothetical protein